MLVVGASQSLLTSLAVIINQQTLGGSHNHVAIIQSASMAGLLCSLFYMQFSQRANPVTVYTRPHVLAWLLLFFVPWAPALAFAGLIFLSSFALHLSSPSLPVVYQTIYPKNIRGKVVAKIRQWQMAAAMLAGWLCSEALEIEPDSRALFYPLLAIAGLVLTKQFSTIKMGRKDLAMASQKIGVYFRILREDKSFLLFMIFQFLLGTCNIAGVAVLSLSVNNQQFQLLSPSDAMLVLTVLPTLAMFISFKAWGYLFDRLSTVHFRALASSIIACGFFFYPFFGYWGLVIGSIVWGIGRAGGQLAWTIGILPFASPDKVRQYMAIHTFLTGLRGVVAPFLGIFLVTQQMSEKTLFLIVGFGILCSALLTLRFVQTPETR